MEFYATVPKSKKGKTRIVGVAVAFDAATINTFYALEKVKKDEYLQNVDYDEVLKKLAGSNASWKITRSQKRSFESKHLLGLPRMW
ncbi:hypothetical protein Patl1_05252 [Pistacia atlantica]|uniref:Uncharacterized protein n=1 Tax=Pistacia atlantica TaxID=434234 RepID=A0ACC1BP55_9ROSI|nr:hypothetical protein Patl1_05252 [Pistacia atlantica]